MGLWQNFKKWRNRPSFPIHREFGGYQAWKDKKPPRQSSWRSMITCVVLVIGLVLLPCGGFALYSASRGTKVSAVPTIAALPESTEVSTEEATEEAELTPEATLEATAESTAETTQSVMTATPGTSIPIVTAAPLGTATITAMPLVAGTSDNTLYDRWRDSVIASTQAAAGREATQQVNSGGGGGRTGQNVITAPPVEIVVTAPPQIIIQTAPPQIIVATNPPHIPTVTRDVDWFASATAYFGTVNPILTETAAAIYTGSAPAPTATATDHNPEMTETVEVTEPPVELTVEATPDVATATATGIDQVETSTATATATPTETATATATETPTVTATEMPTSTPLPSVTPEPTWTWTPEPTFTPPPLDCDESDETCSSVT